MYFKNELLLSSSTYVSWWNRILKAWAFWNKLSVQQKEISSPEPWHFRSFNVLCKRGVGVVEYLLHLLVSIIASPLPEKSPNYYTSRFCGVNVMTTYTHGRPSSQPGRPAGLLGLLQALECALLHSRTLVTNQSVLVIKSELSSLVNIKRTLVGYWMIANRMPGWGSTHARRIRSTP